MPPRTGAGRARDAALLEGARALCQDAAAAPLRARTPVLDVGDTVSLELKSDARHLGVVRAMVRSFATLAGLDEAVVHRVMLAVDEGCANVIRHAYGGRGDGEMQVTCALEGCAGGGRTLLVRLADAGTAPDPARVGRRERGDPLVPGGLGLHLMHDAMDEVVFRTEGGRNFVEMRVRCPAPSPPRKPAP